MNDYNTLVIKKFNARNEYSACQYVQAKGNWWNRKTAGSVYSVTKEESARTLDTLELINSHSDNLELKMANYYWLIIAMY